MGGMGEKRKSLLHREHKPKTEEPLGSARKPKVKRLIPVCDDCDNFCVGQKKSDSDCPHHH